MSLKKTMHVLFVIIHHLFIYFLLVTISYCIDNVTMCVCDTIVNVPSFDMMMDEHVKHLNISLLYIIDQFNYN